MVHAYAGNLLMTTGSYEDASKAFTNSDSVAPCAFAVYQRSRCLLAIGDINSTLQDLEKANEMFGGKNPIATRDKDCLTNLLNFVDYLDAIT